MNNVIPRVIARYKNLINGYLYCLRNADSENMTITEKFHAIDYHLIDHRDHRLLTMCEVPMQYDQVELSDDSTSATIAWFKRNFPNDRYVQPCLRELYVACGTGDLARVIDMHEIVSRHNNDKINYVTAVKLLCQSFELTGDATTTSRIVKYLMESHDYSADVETWGELFYLINNFDKKLAKLWLEFWPNLKLCPVDRAMMEHLTNCVETTKN